MSHVIYAFCLGIPQAEIKMTAMAGMGDKIKDVELLGSSDKVNWKVSTDALVIQPSGHWPCDDAVAYKITQN